MSRKWCPEFNVKYNISYWIHYILKVIKIKSLTVISQSGNWEVVILAYRSTFQYNLHGLLNFHRYERINAERSYAARIMTTIETRSFSSKLQDARVSSDKERKCERAYFFTTVRI